jgi:hypothetical protein
MVDAVAVAALVDTTLVEEELFEIGLLELLATLLEDVTFEEDFELTFEDELTFEEDFELTFEELLETFTEVFRVDVATVVDVLTVAVLVLLLL